MSLYYKIILYKPATMISSEPDFSNPIVIASSSNNQGIISPVVTKEINTAGSLTFTVLPTHPQWSSGFYRMRSVIDVVMRDVIVFRGRVTEISTDFYKQKSITCEGALAWLIDNYRPKSKDILENMLTYSSTVKSELDEYNTRMETYKHFKVGVCEPGGYSGNLIEHEEDVIDNKWYDRSDGVTELSDNDYVCYSRYLPFDSDETYKLYVKNYRNINNSYSTFYCYKQDNTYLGYVAGSTLSKSKISDAGMSYSQVSKFRVAGKGDRGDLFWLTTLDDEVEGTDDNEWDGGSYGDFFVDWVNDSQHMIMRATTDATENPTQNNARPNVLDIFNPNKVSQISSNSIEFTTAPVLKFSDNLIEISSENSEIEPFTIILPIFEGEADLSHFPVVPIMDAQIFFGNIVKAIDFGKKPSDSSNKAYVKRLNKIKSLYNPDIPLTYNVKALDKNLIFDNDEFSIIDVGDLVKVESSPHSIGRVLFCLSMKIDIFNPSNNEYKIGQYIDDSTNSRIDTLTESFTRDK